MVVLVRRPDRRGAVLPALHLTQEAYGWLSPEALAAADMRVRIPMATGVDSLNVATAAAVAFHEVTRSVG